MARVTITVEDFGPYSSKVFFEVKCDPPIQNLESLSHAQRAGLHAAEALRRELVLHGVLVEEFDE